MPVHELARMGALHRLTASNNLLRSSDTSDQVICIMHHNNTTDIIRLPMYTANENIKHEYVQHSWTEEKSIRTQRARKAAEGDKLYVLRSSEETPYSSFTVHNV